MRTKGIFLWCTLFLWLCAYKVGAQPLRFSRVLPPEGKAFIHVTGIVQDGQGYMWLATKKGLFRYDGYQMTSYSHDPFDPASLASDELETIAADAVGNLWIGTLGAGLEQFNLATGTFKHYRHNPADTNGLGSNWITALLADRDGTVWIGTADGLERFHPATGRFVRYRNRPGDATSISSNVVVALYQDRQGTIWVGTGSVYGNSVALPEDGGLNRLDKKTGHFTRYQHDATNAQTLINNKVRTLFEDSKGTFWVGTAGDGLHTMDRKRGTFQRYPYDPANPGKVSRPPLNKEYPQTDWITFIREDAGGALWIGTSESGINYYDPSTQRVTHYESGKVEGSDFTDRTAWTATTSREGVVWVSTLNGNLYRINTLVRKVPFYSFSGPVSSFYEEPDGTLWIGTENMGLVQKSPRGETLRQLVHDPGNPASLGSNLVRTLYTDRQGNNWVGSFGGGLHLWDKKRGTFTRYRYDPRNPRSLSNDTIISIYEDRDARLWVSTVKGLNRMDRKTGQFTTYYFYPKDTVGPNTITTVLEDRQGKLWVGCWWRGGVQRFNPVNGRYKTYLKGSSIGQIYEDRQGTLWAVGYDGLFEYRRTTDSFYRYVDPVSVINIHDVWAFIEDDDQNFWLAVAAGFIKIDRKQNIVTLLARNYGVASTDFVYAASLKDRTGRIYFGTHNGYYAFYPNQLTRGIPHPQIVFSGFRLANQPVRPGKNGPLKAPLWQVEKVQLRHNQNVFSIDFAAIDYTHPEENRHIFMLENYDAEWRLSGSEHRAIYFHVPPGKYTFRVKGSNSYGIWTEKSFDLVILPPWWRTWWAYTLFALLAAGAIWGLVHYRSRQLIQEKRILENRVNERTAQVVKQKEEIAVQRDNLEQALEELKSTQTQLVQREKMASLGEMTAGIAHEIQNPLNFVNNFSEVNAELLEELEKEIDKGDLREAKGIAREIKENELKVMQHGKRAGAIVKGMLQHARNTKGQKEPVDLNALAEEYLSLSYHALRAKEKGFQVVMDTHFDPSIGTVNIVPQDIGRVLLNIFNNAFYAVQEKKRHLDNNYQPVVSVCTKKEKDKVVITIRDNGEGIPADVLDKIFQPFFTTKPTGQGTGLGLSLSYDIITKGHGGTLTVDTQQGDHTEFMIQLPVADK